MSNADTIYLMDDGIPSQSISENANLVATYTIDDILKFENNQTSYLFGGSTNNTNIVVNGNNTINVLMNQKYTITGTGSLTIQYYIVNEQLKDEENNLLYEVFYDTAYLKDENGENITVTSKEELATIFDEIKEYNSLVDGTYDETKATLIPLNEWVNYEIDEAWVKENITTDKDVIYNTDGSVTFSDGNKVLSSDNVLFESSESFKESYKLNVVDILDKASNSLKDEVASSNKVLLLLYDISVIDDNSEIIPMEDGTFTIKVKLTDEMKKYNTLTAAYILDDKIVENFDTTIDGEYVVFNTTHLSEYAILGENTTDQVIENPSTVDNILQYVTILCLSAIGIGYALYTLRKEN